MALGLSVQPRKGICWVFLNQKTPSWVWQCPKCYGDGRASPWQGPGKGTASWEAKNESPTHQAPPRGHGLGREPGSGLTVSAHRPSGHMKKRSTRPPWCGGGGQSLRQVRQDWDSVTAKGPSCSVRQPTSPAHRMLDTILPPAGMTPEAGTRRAPELHSREEVLQEPRRDTTKELCDLAQATNAQFPRLARR